MASKKKVFVRAPYNYDGDVVSEETGLVCRDASKTQQHQAEEADINTIMRKFGITGRVPVVPLPPTFGDFDIGVSDYQSALHLINAANASFAGLSADVRKEFDNDPGRFVEFCSDPKNIDQMRKWGLALPSKDPLDATRVEPDRPA